jgi:predicted transcriptional regulator
MSDAIRRRREQRREFLRRLYDLVDGSVSEFVNAWELGATIELDEPEALKICEYLEEKGLIMIDDHRAGIVRITAAGVDAVEADA